MCVIRQPKVRDVGATDESFAGSCSIACHPGLTALNTGLEGCCEAHNYGVRNGQASKEPRVSDGVFCLSPDTWWWTRINLAEGYSRSQSCASWSLAKAEIGENKRDCFF